ncbi:MAG TPA: DUF2917 domain-containing protein [Burkholderiaceae bacterium]
MRRIPTAAERPTEQLLQLTRGELIAWDRAHPMRLRVLAGLVWITRARDLGDHFLHAGDSFALHPRSRTLIQAERETRLVVEPVENNRSGPRSGRGRFAWPGWLRPARLPAAVALGAP